MEIQQKITQKEWTKYVENEMYRAGFTEHERDAVRAAFAGELSDTSAGELPGFFGGTIRPGITEDELQATMATLRDGNSAFSKSMRFPLSSGKIDKLEAILHEALIANKEGFF